jgi:hypothetical protein
MRVLLFGFYILSFTTLAKAPIFTTAELLRPPSNVIRTCCAFGADLSVAHIPFVKKTDIVAVSEMGMHHYLGSKDERNGIIYTKRGGFIDLGHLRDYADWTVYLYNVILSNIENEEPVVLSLESEGGTKTIILHNLQGLDRLKVSDLAAKIAYDLSVWHEIATWFGSSYIPMIPERYSSFSPEDLYSNLLGAKLAIRAIESDLDYHEAMTNLLATTLDSLEAVATVEQTLTAMEQVENIWWTRKKALPSGKILLQRYLDSESYLIPWLLPGDEDSNSYCKLFKPDPALSSYYEFSIALNRKFLSETMDSTGLNHTITQNDFYRIINLVEDDQRIIEMKSAIRTQKANMRKERKQHDVFWNQV